MREKRKKEKKKLVQCVLHYFGPFLFVSKEVTHRNYRYSDNVENASIEPFWYYMYMAISYSPCSAYIKQNMLRVKYVFTVFAVC